MAKLLNYLYHLYMIDTVTCKYLNKYKPCTVLGENFVNGYYFVVFSTIKRENIKDYTIYYLLVENCKTPLCIELPHTNITSEYIKIDKHKLRKVLPDKILKVLAKQGLCTTAEIALKEGTNPYLLHRLVMCLYANILGLTVHHNNADKLNNSVLNLTPIEEFAHKHLDALQGEYFKKATQKYYKDFKTKFFKTKRNTLASREKNVLETIYKLYKGYSVKNITSRKIKKTKIYEIKRHYYYVHDFVNYTKNCIDFGLWIFNGIVKSCWANIREFQNQDMPASSLLYHFQAKVYEYFETHDKST